MQMDAEKPQRLWLAYVVLIIGIFISIFLWYFVKKDIQPHSALNPSLETYHPWLVLLLGFCISILVAIIIATTQIARERALSLNEMNENLKREIAERISAEDTQRGLESALMQGQKLQAMGTLAGGIAHDFNNLLYAIIGYIEMAREDVSQDSLVYKNLGKVLDASHRGQDLVSRILAFSRRQHHQFDILHIKASIEAALSLLRPTIPASVIIDFKAKEDFTILGNQTQIHQVLVNIINNAVDAMDGEGTITITLDQVSAGDPILKSFPNILQQHYCKIEIADTGHGMDQSTMDRIFEPFYTTKEVGKGTGLGLSIVHTIIKEHQGEITVQSRLGHGTTFMILLPESES